MRQEKRIRQTKAENVLYNDVCSTCNHVQMCTSRKNRQGPVWFCEEFDDKVAVMEPKRVGNEFQIIPPWKDSIPIEDYTQFKGLCINCDNRNTCVNVSLGRGIWYCEEYC